MTSLYCVDGGIKALLSLFHLLDNCLECGGVVEGEVGKHFAVDFNTALVDKTHELGV